MIKTREVNVLELARGAILEQIEMEQTNIMANILDPNTDAKKARKLTITLTFKPDDSREYVAVEAQAKTALAPIMPISTRIMVEADSDGVPRAAELLKRDPNQMEIFEDEEQEQKVLRMRRAN